MTGSDAAACPSCGAPPSPGPCAWCADSAPAAEPPREQSYTGERPASPLLRVCHHLTVLGVTVFVLLPEVLRWAS